LKLNLLIWFNKYIDSSIVLGFWRLFKINSCKLDKPNKSIKIEWMNNEKMDN
jgi:hypothetical protein